MSKPLNMSTAADRSRALLSALGVLAELGAAHDLRGYEISLLPWEDTVVVMIWASPATIAAIFPAKAHAGHWYADDQQRKLTRTIRGVRVTGLQSRRDLDLLDAGARS